MNTVGQGSLGTIPHQAPLWARAFMAIGLEVASQANRSDGETSPVAVLSVPTGQFAAWLIAAGALGAAPKLRPIEQPGVFCCTTWDADSGQIADRVVSVFTSDGKLVHKVGRTSYTRGLPVVRHHIPPPEERARHRTFTKAEVARIRKVIQPMMPRTEKRDRWGLCFHDSAADTRLNLVCLQRQRGTVPLPLPGSVEPLWRFTAPR